MRTGSPTWTTTTSQNVQFVDGGGTISYDLGQFTTVSAVRRRVAISTTNSATSPGPDRTCGPRSRTPRRNARLRRQLRTQSFVPSFGFGGIDPEPAGERLDRLAADRPPALPAGLGIVATDDSVRQDRRRCGSTRSRFDGTGGLCRCHVRFVFRASTSSRDRTPSSPAVK